MKRNLKSLIREISDSLKVEDHYRFGPSELQAKIEGENLEEHSSLVEADVIEDLLVAELYEAPGYDELPDDIQILMVKNAWDFGVTRANILLQSAVGNFVQFHNITGVLTAKDYETAHAKADIMPVLLKERRANLLARLELPNE